jgi:hypothetical protein
MIKRHFAKRDNPWELLILALCCILPGIALMLRKTPLLLDNQGRALTYHAILLPTAAHICGAIVVVVGLIIVWLYFYVLRSAEAEKHVRPRPFLDAR